MTLELLLKNWKRGTLPYVVAAVSTLGCASGVTINNYSGQGGSAGSSQQEGGMGGIGGSEEACLPNNYLICHDGDAYWQDSCGELGDLYQSCSGEEICENGQCVYDCSMVTPTSGCTEQNCAFYDSFEHEICKWNVNSGAPYVSGAASEEKLVIEGNAIVEAKGPFTLAPACNGDFIAQYKAELLDENTVGGLKISHRNTDPNFSGITITHYLAENNKIILDCNGYEESAGDFDLHDQKKLVVRKNYSRLELYVDDELASAVLCSETSITTPVYTMGVIAAGSAVLSQALKIDDVMLYCSSN